MAATALRAKRRASLTDSSRFTARGRQHVGGVGALAAPGLHPPALLEAGEQQVEQPGLGAAGQEPRAKSAQHGEVEAGVSQFQSQGILPIAAGAHGFGRLAVREALGELHDANQGRPPRRQGRLAGGRKKVPEVRIAVKSPEFIAHQQVGVTPGERHGARRAPWREEQVADGQVAETSSCARSTFMGSQWGFANSIRSWTQNLGKHNGRPTRA